MTEQPKLGQIIEGQAYRDAIHVCIAPVVAAEDLKPGTRVGLTYGNRAISTKEHAIGIVDPFLTESVKEGQMFYLLLFPGTVTSLRHSWQHQAFKAKVPNL